MFEAGDGIHVSGWIGGLGDGCERGAENCSYAGLQGGGVEGGKRCLTIAERRSRRDELFIVMGKLKSVPLRSVMGLSCIHI